MNTEFSTKIGQDQTGAIKGALSLYDSLLSWAKDMAKNDLGWPESVIEEWFQDDEEALKLASGVLQKTS